MQGARLLAVLVEFNPNANDNFSGWERPDPETSECVTEPAKRAVPPSRSNCWPAGRVGEPHSGGFAWWSSNDQSYADIRLPDDRDAQRE